MLEAGRVVRVIAGHDQDRFCMVVSVLGRRVAVADGKTRKLAKPKIKNVLHVRATNTVLDPQAVQTDKKLREALKAFQGAALEEGGY